MRSAALLLLAVFLFCGCGTNRVLVNGEWVETLTPREELVLISTARATFSKSRRLSSAEQEMIKKIDPELKIRYTGDKTGDANFVWELPGKRVTLLMRGTFFTNSVQWVMKIHKTDHGIVDFSKQSAPAVEKR